MGGFFRLDRQIISHKRTATFGHGERRTQREVANVAGVTEVTIRNRYKELAEELDIEIIL